MENKVKNQKKKTVVMLMALALMGAGSLYMTGNTFSSYMTEQTASGSAMIAQWDVKFKEGDKEITDSYAFKLIDTKDANSNVDVNTVAPGDKGKITLHVIGENTQVAYTYNVKLNTAKLSERLGDAAAHVQFFTDEACTNAWTDKTDVEVALTDAKKDQTVHIYWKWVPDAAASASDAEKKAWNAADTAAADITKTAEAVFEITLTAKQKIS